MQCLAVQFCLSCRGSALGLELALANRALELRTGDAAAAVLWRVQQVSSFDVDHRASKQQFSLSIFANKSCTKGRIQHEAKQRSAPQSSKPTQLPGPSRLLGRRPVGLRLHLDKTKARMGRLRPSSRAQNHELILGLCPERRRDPKRGPPLFCDGTQHEIRRSASLLPQVLSASHRLWGQ